MHAPLTPPEPSAAAQAEELAQLDREERRLFKLQFGAPDWLRLNPGLGLTAAYIIASITGLVFQSRLLRSFGFNVLEFSDTADFLMVVVREPLTVALALAGVPIYIGYMAVMLRLATVFWKWFPHRRSSPEKRRRTLERSRGWSRLFQWSFICVYATAFIMFYSVWQARQIRAGETTPVTVVYKTDAPLASGGFRHEKVALLGTTTRFLFIYDPVSRTSEAVPLDSVARLIWDARSRKERNAEAKLPVGVPALKDPAKSDVPAPAAAPAPVVKPASPQFP